MTARPQKIKVMRVRDGSSDSNLVHFRQEALSLLNVGVPRSIRQPKNLDALLLLARVAPRVGRSLRVKRD